MGKIYIHDEYFTTVKIPNNHSSNFGPSKAKKLAKQLNLNQSQYNEFIKCNLTGSDYYNLDHGD